MPAPCTLAGSKMSRPPGIVSAGEARWGSAAHGQDPTSDHGGHLPKRDVVWGLEDNAGIPGDGVPASMSAAWPSCTLGSLPFQRPEPRRAGGLWGGSVHSHPTLPSRARAAAEVARPWLCSELQEWPRVPHWGCQGHSWVTRKTGRGLVRPAEVPSGPSPGAPWGQLWPPGPSASLSLL